DTAVGSAVGLVRLVAPLGLVGAGIMVLRTGSGDDGDEPDRAGGRLVAGAGLLLVAITGLLHEARGAPRLDEPVARLTRAGGYLGAVVGQPLRAALAGPGAALVLAVVGLIGVVVLTRTSVRAAADRTA